MKDTIITGLIAMAMFIVFLGYLAQSNAKNPAHGGIPFVLIVIFISGLALYGLWEEIKEEREGKK